MSRRWSDEATLKGRYGCDACGSTTTADGQTLHHAWCLEASASTPKAQSLSIGQAVMAVLGLYGALVVMIGLAIVWSAAHPSFDIVWVLGMLALVVYILAGEMNVP